MFYTITLSHLRRAIKEKSPHTRTEYTNLKQGEVAPLSYLLWMGNEIAKMDTMSADEARKAARWIGWMLAHAELAGLWSNEKSRDLIREDQRLGYDKSCHTM